MVSIFRVNKFFKFFLYFSICNDFFFLFKKFFNFYYIFKFDYFFFFKNSFIFLKGQQFSSFLKFLNFFFFFSFFGFYKKFSIIGLGYKSWIFLNSICFYIGYSHFSLLKIPKQLGIKVRKKVFFLYSLDKQILNFFTYLFLFLKKPDMYKRKGIRDLRSKVKLKVGKKR